MSVITLFLVVIIVSAIVGSFLNVVIHRLPLILQHRWHKEACDYLKQPYTVVPEHLSLAVPGSHCPQCHKPIRWLDNIPIISYLCLQGRCSSCQHPIRLRYLLVELLTVILTCCVFWYFGYGILGVLTAIFTWTLICMFFIDLEHMMIPDQLTLGLMWMGLIVNSFSIFTVPESAVIGAVGGYLCLWLVMQGYRLLTKRQGMGHGDFKLLAAIGAWLGWELLPLVILIAAVLGTIVGIYLLCRKKHERHQPIAFGPYLAIGGWVVMMWGAQIMGLYQTGLGVS